MLQCLQRKVGAALNLNRVKKKTCLKESEKLLVIQTLCLHALRHHLESHHPVVVDVALLLFLSVEVQDEGQVVVQIKL